MNPLKRLRADKNFKHVKILEPPKSSIERFKREYNEDWKDNLVM